MDDWEDWETESAFPSLDNAPKTWDDEEEESSDDEVLPAIEKAESCVSIVIHRT